MRIKHAMVRLGMFVAALAAASAFAGAIPANAAAVNHADSVIAAVPISGDATAAPDEGPYPPVCNCFSIWLTASPNGYMVPACTSQTIYLTSGAYEWAMTPADELNGANPSPYADIDLASSNYSWGDCIIPANNYYIQSSELCPLDLPPQDGCVNRTVTYYVDYSGTYTVGSELDWLCDNCTV
jgi:hypothetical protein